MKYLALRFVVKAHTAEFNFTVGVVRCNCIRCVFNLRLHVVVLENTREHGHGTNPVDLNVQQLVYRHVHLAEKSHEHAYLTDGNCRVEAHHYYTADKVDEHRTDVCKSSESHTEPASGHAFFNVEPNHFSVGGLVAFILRLFHSEELYEKLTAYGKCFVENAVYLVTAGLRFTGDLEPAFSGTSCRNDKQRYYSYADQRKLPVFTEHENQCNGQCDGV